MGVYCTVDVMSDEQTSQTYLTPPSPLPVTVFLRMTPIRIGGPEAAESAPRCNHEEDGNAQDVRVMAPTCFLRVEVSVETEPAQRIGESTLICRLACSARRMSLVRIDGARFKVGWLVDAADDNAAADVGPCRSDGLATQKWRYAFQFALVRERQSIPCRR